MNPETIQTLWTLGAFGLFSGIVVWAWSRRAEAGFREAERLPFAEGEAATTSNGEDRGR